MVAKVKTFSCVGLTGHEITVEADYNRSLPGIEIIGLPDSSIKESKDRLRATFRNCGIDLPARKFVLNLAPSDSKKIGTSFDVPMALGVLILLSEQNFHHKNLLEEALFFGELGLDGSVKRINGLLPCVISAIKVGYKIFFVPEENCYELEYLQDITVYPLSTFSQLIDCFYYNKLRQPHPLRQERQTISSNDQMVDFGDVRGHLFVKRALMIAAAGMHNTCLVGPPGSGKTLLSKALHSILPPLTFQEVLEVSQIYSLVGKLSKHHPLITKRPFRQVHHTASKVSIIGGGALLKPGEISLAHRGILFFDELTEFPREVVDVLRQPIEDKMITISRAVGSVDYPASMMFVAAMNPCKCGFFNDKEKSCSCSLFDVKKYQTKISGPLLDRIDIILEVPRESTQTLLSTNTSDQHINSAQMREIVGVAWERQQYRYKGTSIITNAHLTAKTIHHYITIDEKSEQFLHQVAKQYSFSSRVIHRLLRLARTIADIADSDEVIFEHVAEAFQYRNKALFVDE